jgi:hypothetical protein
MVLALDGRRRSKSTAAVTTVALRLAKELAFTRKPSMGRIIGFQLYEAGAMPINIPTPTTFLEAIGEAVATVVDSNLRKPISIDSSTANETRSSGCPAQEVRRKSSGAQGRERVRASIFRVSVDKASPTLAEFDHAAPSTPPCQLDVRCR